MTTHALDSPPPPIPMPDHRRRNVTRFRGPFVVWVRPNADGWLITVKSHNWLHTDKCNAIRDEFVASTFGVAVNVELREPQRNARRQRLTTIGDGQVTTNAKENYDE